MNKVLPIFLFLLIISCCKRIESYNSVWEIKSVTPDHPYFNKSLMIEFNSSDILVWSKESGDTFPAIINNDRMVIETGSLKWLFEIEKTSDSAMILYELYSKKPIEIILVKIKNNHKS